MMIGAYVITACLIAPALTLAALATGFLLAWVLRGRLSESLRLGKTLSTAYEELYHHISEFLAGLKITKSYVSEDSYVTAFAGAIDEVKGSLFAYKLSQPNAQTFQETYGVVAVAIFLWASADLLHMPIAEVLVLALIACFRRSNHCSKPCSSFCIPHQLLKRLSLCATARISQRSS